jgi:hypothetical protein
MTQLTRSPVVIELDRTTTPIPMADRPGAISVDLDGVEWSGRRPLELPPPVDCVAFEPPAHVVSFGRFELRFDPERPPFSGDRAHIGGYVRPLEARPGDAAWLAGSFEIHDSAGGLAVEHGRLTQLDGTVVAESFHTRLTARG